MTNWINTVSRGHVERGVRGHFTQANHGKPHMLKKMAKGDWIIFYSPKKTYPDGEPLNANLRQAHRSLHAQRVFGVRLQQWLATRNSMIDH